MRPAITEYRITNIIDSAITFWYQKPDSSKKIYLITLPIAQFIGKLLPCIPPENFKTIRRFELYSIKNSRKLSFLKAKFLRLNVFLKPLRRIH